MPGAVRLLPSGRWQARGWDGGGYVALGAYDTKRQAQRILDEYRAGRRIVSNVIASDLMGVSEVSLLLGMSGRRLQQLQDRGQFVVPFAVLDAGPIWLREDVEQWAETQPPGPKRTTLDLMMEQANGRR